MTPMQTLYKDAEDKMKRAVATITREFGEIRGGRATPAFLDHVMVDYYGAATPLIKLAVVTSPEVRMLVIQPYDANSTLDIEKAIQKAGLGITRWWTASSSACRSPR